MLYKVFNGPAPTTTVLAKVATTTSIRTLLQVKPLKLCKVKEWGIAFDASSPATPIQCELIETGTVFATVTALADADVVKYGAVADAAVASVAGLTLGTAATGYTASAEGTITASRLLDHEQVPPTSSFSREMPLGDEPVIQIGFAGRIRVLAGATVNATCYMLLEV